MTAGRLCDRIHISLSEWRSWLHSSPRLRHAGSQRFRSMGKLLRHYSEHLRIFCLLRHSDVLRRYVLTATDSCSACQSLLLVSGLTSASGMAIVIILNSLSPGFLRMRNTLPESAGISTPQLIGFCLFIVVYVHRSLAFRKSVHY